MSSRFSIVFSRWLARLVSRHPLAVLAVGLALAVGAIGVTVDQLRFQPDRNDLLSEDLEWNQRILDWWASFPHMSDMVAAVDTTAGPGDAAQRRERAESFVRDLALRLEDAPEIVNVDWGAPEAAFGARAARLQQMESFRRTIERVEESGPIVKGASASDALALMSKRLASGDRGGSVAGGGLVRGIQGLARFVGAIGRAVDAHDEARNPFAALGGQEEEWRFLESPNGRFLFVRLTPRNVEGVLDATAQSIATVREAIEELEEEHAGIEVGLTGIDVVESDETEVATVDSALSSVVAFLVIVGLLVTAFHGWRKPLQAMLALVVGIAWTFGFLTLAIGHLQILSVVFVVILLGLGIDFAIHLSTTIEEFRHNHPDGREPFREVLSESFRVTGPGVLTGAATTAAAFASTTFTDFRGVAELGIIACGGIVLCMISMFTLYPAMLARFHHSHRHIRPLGERSVHLFHGGWLNPIVRRPWVAVGVAGALMLVAGIAGTRVRFSEDLLALQPRGVESVEWQQRIAEEGDVSIWYAVSICSSLEQAEARRDAFRSLSTVAQVGGIGVLFPDREEEKLALIRRARAELGLDGRIPEPEPERSGALRSQLTRMRSLMEASTRGAKLGGDVGAALESLREAIEGAVAALDGLTEEETAIAMERLSSAYQEFRAGVVDRVEGVLDPSPVRPDDLPRAIIDSFVDRTEPGSPRYALEVHPRVPERSGITSPLDPRFLAGFVRDVQSVDPDVTGVLPQIYFSNQVIRSAFMRSGAIAVVVVFVIVLVVFRSVVDAATCMMPVVVGFVLTFGVMAVTGMTVNPANIIVLPLLFGIGVDSGVHVMHRYRLNPHERPLGLTHGTGKGVTLTCLTTMAGFASMLVARHRGIEGLGLLLTIGIGLTLLTCWTVLPAVLELRARGRKGGERGERGPASERDRESASGRAA